LKNSEKLSTEKLAHNHAIGGFILKLKIRHCHNKLVSNIILFNQK